jgi:thiol-disulfide isomerase/thioredoxin
VDALLLSVRCLLAVVFIVAAIGKLLDLEGSRRALVEFGMPSRAARVGGVLLPVAELAVAVAMLLVPTARWGAAGAFLLLLAFSAGIARAMSRGEAPDCHCFGQIHSEPAGSSALVRNAVLSAASAFVVLTGPGPSLDSALGTLHGAQIALVATSALAAVLAVAVAQLWADRRRLRAELNAAQAAELPPGLPRGTSAPAFELAAVRGTAGSLAGLSEQAGPTVLVFLSTGCGPCQTLLPSLAHWQDALSGSVTVAAIFEGARDEVGRVSAEHELSPVLAQKEQETFELYALRATPSAVLIGADGTIAGAPAEGVTAIEALVRTAAAESRPFELVVERA